MPDPHELWRQANGDAEEYHRLMLKHGLIIQHTEETKPKPHVFEGMTPACACSVCHGIIRASWHHLASCAIFTPGVEVCNCK